MTTASTASSGTDGPEPGDDAGAGSSLSAPATAVGPSQSPPAGQVHDATRRAFFLEFGKQAVTAVGQVAGMADLVGRASGGSVAGLLGLEAPTTTARPPEFARSSRGSRVSAAAPAADGAFRSAYRLGEDGLVLLDQRGIPERLDEVLAKRGSDVAHYLRLGVVRGGAVMAQVAAYGVALTAQERVGQRRQQRHHELARTLTALAEARPSARLPAWAMERMRPIIEHDVADAAEEVAPDGAVVEGTDQAAAETAEQDRANDGLALAQRLRAEADAIATDMGAWNATIAASLHDHLAALGTGPLTVLLHGVHGPLAGGVVGSGLSALQRLRDEGRGLRVFVTEARPFMDGARLASWELRQAGIAHQVIPDGAVAWLLGREAVDVALLAAEWVAANGDTGALIGSRAVAELARLHGTTVVVSGFSACVDAATTDGSAIPDELRPARDLAAYLADVPIGTSTALVPAADVVAASTIDLLITERGTVAPQAAG
jgi:methylthioribose-1-phosphate isomerase